MNLSGHRHAALQAQLDLQLAARRDPTGIDTMTAIRALQNALADWQKAIWAARDQVYAAMAGDVIGHWWNPATQTVYRIDASGPGVQPYEWVGGEWVEVEHGAPVVINGDAMRRLTPDEEAALYTGGTGSERHRPRHGIRLHLPQVPLRQVSRSQHCAAATVEGRSKRPSR